MYPPLLQQHCAALDKPPPHVTEKTLLTPPRGMLHVGCPLFGENPRLREAPQGVHLQQAGIQFLSHPLQFSDQAAELNHCPGDARDSGHLCWHVLQLAWPLLREGIQLSPGSVLTLQFSLQPVGPTVCLKLQKRGSLRFNVRWLPLDLQSLNVPSENADFSVLLPSWHCLCLLWVLQGEPCSSKMKGHLPAHLTPL